MAKKAFFMMRLNDHIQYLKKIDTALKGESDFQGTDHTECKLGHWIYGDGVGVIAALKNAKAKEIFESLIQPHERFHEVSRQALLKKQQHDEKGVEIAMTEMHLLSTTLINKLLELDGLELDGME